MTECKFEAAEGAEAIVFSHGDRGFVVQTLDNSDGKVLLVPGCVSQLAQKRFPKSIPSAISANIASYSIRQAGLSSLQYSAKL